MNLALTYNNLPNRFNEEMIETLFGYTPTGKNRLPTKKESAQDTPKFIQIIDAKKAQNLSILLKALSVTTQEVGDALEEGHFASLVSIHLQNGTSRGIFFSLMNHLESKVI